MPEERMGEEEIEQRMQELEENPPKDLKDWPAERDLRMQTFGGREGTHGYNEGPEEKLGPSDVRHHEDGSVSVKGEKVDNPEDFKGERIQNVADDPEGRAEDERRAKDERSDGDDGRAEDQPRGAADD